MQPQIDIELRANPFCFLNRERVFDIWLSFRLHYREPVALTTTGSIFDPAATFIKSRIEIIDTESGEKVHFPESHTLPGEENPLSAEGSTLTLRPEAECCIYWSTGIHDGRGREHAFDISPLAPNRQYTIEYRDHGIPHYSLGSPPTQQENRSDVDIQSLPIIAMNVLAEKAPSFTTRPTLPPLPPITTVLTTSAPTCSLSGTPPFTVVLDRKLAGDRPICALLTGNSGMNIGLEIRDPTRNGRRIGPSPDEQCGDQDYDSPDEEELVRFGGVGGGFSQQYTLATRRKARGLVNADTWNLKSGNVYGLTVRQTRWRWLFEDELGGEGEGGRAVMMDRLGREPEVQWKPDCWVEFRAD